MLHSGFYAPRIAENTEFAGSLSSSLHHISYIPIPSSDSIPYKIDTILQWALEPECRILVFMWSIGATAQGCHLASDRPPESAAAREAQRALKWLSGRHPSRCNSVEIIVYRSDPAMV